jgi:hypothetical protein
MELTEKNTREAFELLKKAATLIHDTGETESDTLDKAVCFTQDAIDQLEYFLKEKA